MPTAAETQDVLGVVGQTIPNGRRAHSKHALPVPIINGASLIVIGPKQAPVLLTTDISPRTKASTREEQEPCLQPASTITSRTIRMDQRRRRQQEARSDPLPIHSSRNQDVATRHSYVRHPDTLRQCQPFTKSRTKTGPVQEAQASNLTLEVANHLSLKSTRNLQEHSERYHAPGDRPALKFSEPCGRITVNEVEVQPETKPRGRMRVKGAEVQFKTAEERVVGKTTACGSSARSNRRSSGQRQKKTGPATEGLRTRPTGLEPLQRTQLDAASVHTDPTPEKRGVFANHVEGPLQETIHHLGGKSRIDPDTPARVKDCPTTTLEEHTKTPHEPTMSGSGSSTSRNISAMPCQQPTRDSSSSYSPSSSSTPRSGRRTLHLQPAASRETLPKLDTTQHTIQDVTLTTMTSEASKHNWEHQAPFGGLAQTHLCGCMMQERMQTGSQRDNCSCIHKNYVELDASPAAAENASPVLLKHDFSTDIESDADGYETPLTSPSTSPVKARDRTYEFGPLQVDVVQLDGPGENPETEHAESSRSGFYKVTSLTRITSLVRDASVTLEDDVATNPTEKEASGTCVRQTSSLETLVVRHTECGTENIVEDDQSQTDTDESTPLVPPVSTKALEAVPFAIKKNESAPKRAITRFRRPSALLCHCEGLATSRQRQLMSGGRRTPDRFIPTRDATPTKEGFLLSKPVPKLPASRQGNGRSSPPLDPFGPTPRRSLRVAQRFTTVRTPPPPSRPYGIRTSLVGDAQTSILGSGPTTWTVGGSPVTEGVASTTNGRGGRVTSGSNAPHYLADFLRRNTPSEEEATHGRRLALAMDIDQGARMMDHSLPSSPSTPSSGQSNEARTWKYGVWEAGSPQTSR